MSAETAAAPSIAAVSVPAAVSRPRRWLVVARHTALLLARDPGTMLAYTVMAMVLLTMLRPVYVRLGAAGGGAPIDRQAPGTAVMFTLLALDVAGQSLLSERTWHTWDRLRAGSVGRLTVLVGKAIPLTVLFAVQQVVLFVFADAAFGFDIAAGSWRLPLTVALWGLCVSGLGLAVGAWTRTQGQLSAAADVGALAVTCLSGSLVPLAILPHWVSQVAPWTPAYWALRGFQGAVEGGGSDFLEALGVLAGITVLALAAASLRPMPGRGRC
ncbi:ABC transporter permease [Actinospica durhamensis]|uniref:ABC transporter permease n=1 Tax=Actinospica durhamensis TaxID=1508375 RepID=A0A941ESN8_9ACTN|nr:ABC transporter permease [Actinospica durhamensis]MBR7836316.1 ABC transporter permease [Actinospica durhamensis]